MKMRVFRCNSIWTLNVSWIFVTLVFVSLFLQCSAVHSERFVPASTRFQRRGSGRAWSSQQAQYQQQISPRRLQRFQQMANQGRGGQGIQNQIENNQQAFGRNAQRQVNRPPQERFRNTQPQVRSGRFDVSYRRNNQDGSSNNRQNTQIRNNGNVNRPTVDRNRPRVRVNTQWVNQPNTANLNNNDNNNYNTNIQPQLPTQQRPQRPLIYNPDGARGPPLVNANSVVVKPNPLSVVPINSVAQPSNFANTVITNNGARPSVVMRAKGQVPIVDRSTVQVKPKTVLERTNVKDKLSAMTAVPQEAMMAPYLVQQKQSPILIRQPLVDKDISPRVINSLKDNKFNASSMGPIILRQKGRNKPYIVIIRKKNGKLARKLIQMQRPGIGVNKTKSVSAPMSPGVRLPDKVAIPATPIVYRPPVFIPATNRQRIPIPVPPVPIPSPKLSSMADISSMLANIGNANSIQNQVSNVNNNQGPTALPPPRLPPLTDISAMLSNIVNANSFQNQVPNVNVHNIQGQSASPRLSPINDISVMLSKFANANTLQNQVPNVNVQNFPQSLTPLLNNPGQSLAGNFGNVGNLHAIGGAMNQVQTGMFNPFASFAPQQPYSQISMIGSWDGSSASVPLAMQQMGITHGSQLSPAMQEMMFGDSIDPPDPTTVPTPSTIGTTVGATDGVVIATTHLPLTTQKSNATKNKLRKGWRKNKKKQQKGNKQKQQKGNKQKQRKGNKQPAWTKPTSLQPTTPVIPLVSLNVEPSTTTPNPTDVAVSLAKKLISLMNNGNAAANDFLKALNVDLPPSKFTDSSTISPHSMNTAEPSTNESVVQYLPGTMKNTRPDVSLSSFQSSNEIGGVKVERIVRPPAVKIDKPYQNPIKATLKIKIAARLPIVETAQPLAPAVKEIMSPIREFSLAGLVQLPEHVSNGSSMSVPVETQPHKPFPAETQASILTPVSVETQDNNMAPLLSISKTFIPTSTLAVDQAPIAAPIPSESNAPILPLLPTEKKATTIAILPIESHTPISTFAPAGRKSFVTAPLPAESKSHIMLPLPIVDRTHISASTTAKIPSVSIDEALKMLEFSKGATNESSLDLLIGLLSSMQSGLVTTTSQTMTTSTTATSIPQAEVNVVSPTAPPPQSTNTPEPRKQQQLKCTHLHPGFQCKGKDFFATLETTGKWCIETCRERGCVKSVCDCNCNGVVRPPMKGQNPPQAGRRRQNNPNGNKKNVKNNRRRMNKQQKRRRWQKPKTTTTEEPPEIEAEDMVSTTEAMTTTDSMTTTDIPDDSTYGFYMDGSQVTSSFGNDQGPKTLPPQVAWGSESRVHFSNLGVNNAVTTPANTQWVASRPPPSWRGTAWELPPAPVKPKKDAKQSGGEEEEATKPATVGWSGGGAGSWQRVTPPSRWNSPARNSWNNNGPRFTGGSRNTWKQPVGARAGPGAWGDPPPLRESGGNNWRGNMFGNRRSVDSGFRLRDTWRSSKSSNKAGGEEKEQ